MPPGKDLAERSLNAAECVGAVGRNRFCEQSGHHFQLHRQPGGGLQREPIHESRFGIECVHFFGIPVNQQIFPRDKNIVENHHRIVFIETAGEWMVERAVRIHLVRRPANRLAPGESIGAINTMAKSLALSLSSVTALFWATKVALVKADPGGQHLRAGYHDAVIPLFDHVYEDVFYFVHRPIAIHRGLIST